jgi:glutamate-1-semialdehyde 2,1-aminomutase
MTMDTKTLPRGRTARFLEPGSATARLHAQADALIPGATSRLHYYFKPYPIVARSGRGSRLIDVDGDERIDCLNNMTALVHGHADADVHAAIVEQA